MATSCTTSLATNVSMTSDVQCKVAVALSGEVSWSLPDNLENLAHFVVSAARRPGCLFVHGYANRDDGWIATLRSMAQRVPGVRGVAIEGRSSRHGVASLIADCTRSSFVHLADELRRRNGGRRSRLGSMIYSAPMFRNIWLSVFMARHAAPHAEFIVRARVDHRLKMPLDWAAVAAASARGRMCVGLRRQHYATQVGGVPVAVRCVADDQFAVGPPALIELYARVFADFWRLLLLLPLWRIDMIGHTNERIVAAQLRFRRVPYEFLPIDGGIYHHRCGCAATRRVLLNCTRCGERRAAELNASHVRVV